MVLRVFLFHLIYYLVIEEKMYYNYYQTTQYEFDECVAKGVCSIGPTLSSLQEVILLYLGELSFYLLELQTLGVSNEKIKENIIDIISGLVENVEYSQEQFQNIANVLCDDLAQAKQLYLTLCQKHSLETHAVKSSIKIAKQITFNEAIQLGEKHFQKKSKQLSSEQKNLYEVIFLIIKSLCINLIELRDLDEDDKEAYQSILTMLSSLNFLSIPASELHEKIERFVTIDYAVSQRLYERRIEKYGPITPTEVSFSTRPNKAILVSGSNIRELELVLKATKNRNIDVYTHGAMIMGHSFPKIKEYPNLVGHFGKGPENSLLDFAVFPGAIFMTRHSMQKVEHLYRGRLFTTNTIAPRGVIIIKNNNFEPLIESTLTAKGFTTGQERPSAIIGFNEKEILQKLKTVAEKVHNKEIKHVFVIGVSNHTNTQRQYFEKLISLIKKDCFILTFSYTDGSENIMHVDSDYGYPIFYKILNLISPKMTIKDLKLTLLLTRCDQHSISNLINVKLMGVDDIYMTNCSPNMLNPTLLESLRKIYKIHNYTNPKDDLNAILGRRKKTEPTE